MELQYSKKKKFEPNMQLKWQENIFLNTAQMYKNVNICISVTSTLNVKSEGIPSEYFLFFKLGFIMLSNMVLWSKQTISISFTFGKRKWQFSLNSKGTTIKFVWNHWMEFKKRLSRIKLKYRKLIIIVLIWNYSFSFYFLLNKFMIKCLVKPSSSRLI